MFAGTITAGNHAGRRPALTYIKDGNPPCDLERREELKVRPKKQSTDFSLEGECDDRTTLLFAIPCRIDVRRGSGMPIWRLTPLDLADPSWEASSHRGMAIVRAPTERLAREEAQKVFGVKTGFTPGGGVKAPPWAA